MFRINGSVFAGSKSGGVCTHAWIFLPSKLEYQISSGSVRFNSENRAPLMLVICRCLPSAFSTNSSSIMVGVDTFITTTLPSSEVVNCCTARSEEHTSELQSLRHL